MLPGTSLMLEKQGRSPMYLYLGLIAQAFLRSFDRSTARETKEPRLAVLSLAPMTAMFSGQRARLSVGRMGFKVTSRAVVDPYAFAFNFATNRRGKAKEAADAKFGTLGIRARCVPTRQSRQKGEDI